MPGARFALRSRRVLTPAGFIAATVVVDDGRIEGVIADPPPEVAAPDATNPGGPGDGAARGLGEVAVPSPLLDVGDDVVMPGVIDFHVHANDPGRRDWEGLDFASRAAAAGGITTFLDMPLNSVPPTTTLEGLAAKLEAARDRLWVDVGLWGGLVPGNQRHLEALWEAGVFGFKAFLAPSGVEEFPAVGEADLLAALPTLARLGAPLLVHAELPELLDATWGKDTAGDDTHPADRRRYAAYLASRPAAAETAAVELVTRLAAAAGARVHVVHVSAAETLAVLRRARRAAARAGRTADAVTAETCPHYLVAAAAEIADGATAWKCAPPVREAPHREALWQGLLAGDLDLVASDHSPSPPAGKQLASGDFATAWGGIASLQLLLPLVWSGARRRGIPLNTVARWLTAAPATVAGLGERKGVIAPGRDADLVVWDPETSFTVDPAALLHRHPVSPYAGRTLHGVVRRTFLRGVEVYDGTRPSARPHGKILRR